MAQQAAGRPDRNLGGIALSVAIQVENLAYQYPGVDNTPGTVVFEDLSLSIEEGTFVAVLGSNGCGKSGLS